MARDVAALVRLGRQVAVQQGFSAGDPTIDWARYGQEAEYRIGRNQGVPPPDKFRIGHAAPRRAARGTATAPLPASTSSPRRTVRIGAFEVGYHELEPATNRPQHKYRRSERTTGRYRKEAPMRRARSTIAARAKARGVPFADPGYRPDHKPRYRLDTVKRVRAAWAYINRPAYAKFYSAAHLRLIHQRIQAAGRRFGVEFGHARTRSAMAVRMRAFRPSRLTGFTRTVYGVERIWADGTITREYFETKAAAAANAAHLRALVRGTR